MNSSPSDLMSWWATVHEPKKNLGIENPLEWLFLVSFSIIENILLLHRPLEMLLYELENTKRKKESSPTTEMDNDPILVSSFPGVFANASWSIGLVVSPTFPSKEWPRFDPSNSSGNKILTEFSFLKISLIIELKTFSSSLPWLIWFGCGKGWNQNSNLGKAGQSV